MEKIFIRKQDQEVKAVCHADPKMNQLIKAIGDIEITLRTDYFKSLVRSIVGQQISVAAASAIYGRLDILLENAITPDSLLQVTEEQLREVGLTYRKIAYVQDLASKVQQSELNLLQLTDLDNQTIIKQLTSVKGIGKWTAEIYHLLSLRRMDVSVQT